MPLVYSERIGSNKCYSTSNTAVTCIIGRLYRAEQHSTLRTRSQNASNCRKGVAKESCSAERSKVRYKQSIGEASNSTKLQLFLGPIAERSASRQLQMIASKRGARASRREAKSGRLADSDEACAEASVSVELQALNLELGLTGPTASQQLGLVRDTNRAELAQKHLEHRCKS